MDKKFSVIGLGGTNGSGKDSVGNILAEDYGYLFISVTDLLRVEVEKRGLEVTRENLRTVGNEWRRDLGAGVLVDKAMEAYESSKDKYKGVVISSLRNPGEADRLHEFGGTVVWVDADQKLRYERIQANAANRGRAGEDDLSFDQFKAEEAAEMSRPSDGDQATLDMAEVKQKSDLTILNNNGSLSELKASIQKALSL